MVGKTLGKIVMVKKKMVKFSILITTREREEMGFSWNNSRICRNGWIGGQRGCNEPVNLNLWADRYLWFSYWHHHGQHKKPRYLWILVALPLLHPVTSEIAELIVFRMNPFVGWCLLEITVIACCPSSCSW